MNSFTEERISVTECSVAVDTGLQSLGETKGHRLERLRGEVVVELFQLLHRLQDDLLVAGFGDVQVFEVICIEQQQSAAFNVVVDEKLHVRSRV
ncbi:hypothetical protein TYRP_010058 [Tyrophagus putrescentiae]|nr:hypothetical protein TYRP_010058 [Tyrophagus putrescentiae]